MQLLWRLESCSLWFIKTLVLLGVALNPRTSGRAFGADGKSRVFPTGQTGWESSNTVTHTVKLAVKEGRSSTLPLRSDDAGHQVEETIESYFRLVEG